MTKQRLLHILSTLYTDTVVDREELVIFKSEYAWQLHVDVLVMDELSLYQLDMIGASIRAAFQNLRLPQVIATLNANSNKIEVGLVEDIYPDKANTDALLQISSAQDAPFIVSIALMRDQQQDIVVLDVDAFEIQCVDQILHLAVDSKMRVRGFVQSKGLNSRK